MIASPCKLRSGERGAKVQGAPRVGQAVTVQTKAGKSWPAVVAKVVWSDGGVSIVATAKKPSTCCVGGVHYKRESGYCYYPCPAREVRRGRLLGDCGNARVYDDARVCDRLNS